MLLSSEQPRTQVCAAVGEVHTVMIASIQSESTVHMSLETKSPGSYGLTFP